MVQHSMLDMKKKDMCICTTIHFATRVSSLFRKEGCNKTLAHLHSSPFPLPSPNRIFIRVSCRVVFFVVAIAVDHLFLIVPSLFTIKTLTEIVLLYPLCSLQPVIEPSPSPATIATSCSIQLGYHLPCHICSQSSPRRSTCLI